MEVVGYDKIGIREMVIVMTINNRAIILNTLYLETKKL